MRRIAFIVPLILMLSACGDSGRPGDSQDAERTLTVYSGREKDLVEPLFALFEKATGIKAEVRYGDSAELAATIAEEGGNSPADVFFAQDAGALGAVAQRGILASLDQSLLAKVPERFRSPQGQWVGVTGRARTIVYNTEAVKPSDLPADVFALTDPRWKGKVGWAPTNGSFQAFVTAMRLLDGQERARKWLTDMKDNGTQVYPKNTPIVEATGAGEIELGLVNHYYLLGLKKENPELAAANHFVKGGAGALVNVAGAGVLTSSKHEPEALEFIEYLLGPEAQRFFATETFEYPLVEGVSVDAQLPPLSSLQTPDLNLSTLADLEATLQLLRDTGVL